MINSIRYLFALVWATLTYGCQHTQPSQLAKSRLSLALDSLIDHEHRANRFSGTVVVGASDTILFQKAVGVADRVWNVPLQTDHRFDICSLNKSFIAALIMMATEEGRLSLESRLINKLDAYEYTGRYHPDITVHQMLTHTSGLPDYQGISVELAENNFRKFKRKHFSNAAYVDFISQIPAVGEPGERFYYSNFAYHLLAILLEDIYQQPFAKLLQDKICKPLSLAHTFATVSNQEVHKSVAEGYHYQPKTGEWLRNQFIDLTLGRRIFSSTQDLYRWGKAVHSTALLNEESRRIMLTNHLVGIDDDISYGYGWVVFDGKKKYSMGNLNIDQEYIIHGGSTEGYKSILVSIDKGDFIVAILSNAGDQADEPALAQSIVHLLIDHS